MTDTTRHCSFCGKSEHVALCLVAGYGDDPVLICEACVDTCTDIVRERRKEKDILTRLERLEEKVDQIVSRLT